MPILLLQTTLLLAPPNFKSDYILCFSGLRLQMLQALHHPQLVLLCTMPPITNPSSPVPPSLGLSSSDFNPILVLQSNSSSNFRKISFWGWGFSSVVERLPSKCKVLGSVPSSGKKRKEKKRKERKKKQITKVTLTTFLTVT